MWAWVSLVDGCVADSPSELAEDHIIYFSWFWGSGTWTGHSRVKDLGFICCCWAVMSAVPFLLVSDRNSR